MATDFEHKKIAVVVPVYNEESVVGDTLGDLMQHGFTVVVVDDGSTDNTRQAVEHLPVHYLRHATNLGQGAALQTGFSFARQLDVDCFVSFDADGQHKAADILPMANFLRQLELDIVYGSRFLGIAPQHMPRSRFLLLKTAIWVNYFFSGIRLSDAHNGFRAMSRAFVEKVMLTENRMAHATEIMTQTCKYRLRYGEWPTAISYTNYSREKGQRNIDGFKTLQSLILHKLFVK